MKTKRDIVKGALRELREIDALEAPTAEDYDVMAGRYDALLSILRDDGKVYWPNTGNDVAEIPDQVETALVYILAGHAASMFGKQEPVKTDLGGVPRPITATGIRMLAQHVANAQSGEQTWFSDY